LVDFDSHNAAPAGTHSAGASPASDASSVDASPLESLVAEPSLVVVPASSTALQYFCSHVHVNCAVQHSSKSLKQIP